MIDLIVVDSFDSSMFKVQVEDSLAVAMGEKMFAKYDKDGNFISRAISWEDFQYHMNRAY